jgi:hypothetical protein
MLVPVSQGCTEDAVVEEPVLKPGGGSLKRPHGTDEEDGRGNAGQDNPYIAQAHAEEAQNKKRDSDCG